MAISYRYDLRSAWLPGAAGVGLVIATATTAALQTGAMQIAFAGIAGLGVIGLLGVLPVVVDRRVQLSVGAQGLIYRPFSPDHIPWSDITAVAIVRTQHQFGWLLSVMWKKTHTRESVKFDVLDSSRFARGQPLYRVSARLMNQGPVPTFPIETAFLRDVETAQLAREIARYWKGPIETFLTRRRV